MEGTLSSVSLQTDGQPLLIYVVGWCELGINGRPCHTQFKSAALSPFNVILSESWLRENHGVLDYADNRLWQKDMEGNLRPLTFDLPGNVTPVFEAMLGSMKAVAEGVRTAKAASGLAQRHGVEMPIVREINEVLFEGKSCRQAVADLMERDAKPEKGQA